MRLAWSPVAALVLVTGCAPEEQRGTEPIVIVRGTAPSPASAPAPAQALPTETAAIAPTFEQPAMFDPIADAREEEGQAEARRRDPYRIADSVILET